MKKTIKKSSRHQNSSGTGIALLICFVIATVAVAVAIRQLVLERRYMMSKMMPTATPATTTTLSGDFVAELSDRTIDLKLSSDRTAVITHDHANNKLDFKENGLWSGDTNGTVIVSIGDKTTYAFSSQDNMLTLLNPDVKIWGNNKVTFSKKQ